MRPATVSTKDFASHKAVLTNMLVPTIIPTCILSLTVIGLPILEPSKILVKQASKWP